MYTIAFIGMRYQTPGGVANPYSLVALVQRVLDKAEVDHAMIEKDCYHHYQLSCFGRRQPIDDELSVADMGLLPDHSSS